MCIYGGKVLSVKNTRMFARMTPLGRQVLVYQSAFVTAQDVALILPLPIVRPIRPDGVRFISLKAYPQFFERMRTGFPQMTEADLLRAGLVTRSSVSWFDRAAYERSGMVGVTSSAAGSTPTTLPVVRVGDYEASVVPSLGDMDRLDPRFRLPRRVWSQIPAYHDYAFAVFRLHRPALPPGATQVENHPHPMALEFETRMPDALFLPTAHLGDGHKTTGDRTVERFDHELYVQGSQLRATHLSDVPDTVPTSLLREDRTGKPLRPTLQRESVRRVSLTESMFAAHGTWDSTDLVEGVLASSTGSAARSPNADAPEIKVRAERARIGFWPREDMPTVLPLSEIRTRNRAGEFLFVPWEIHGDALMRDGFPVVTNPNFPRELYLRKSRGFAARFHSSVLRGVVDLGAPCFQRILTGAVLDGRDLSSAGDVIIPLAARLDYHDRPGTTLGPPLTLPPEMMRRLVAALRKQREQRVRGDAGEQLVEVQIAMTCRIEASGRLLVDRRSSDSDRGTMEYAARFVERRWRGRPEIRQGKKVPSKVVIRFTFPVNT